MNSVCLSGRIAGELELRYTQNGVAVASFCVAVDRPRVKDTTDFIECVAWRNSAEFVTKYFKKGDLIEVQGVLTVRTYKNKNGENRKVVEVLCDNIFFAKSRKHDDSQQNVGSQEFQELDGNDGDLPF